MGFTREQNGQELIQYPIWSISFALGKKRVLGRAESGWLWEGQLAWGWPQPWALGPIKGNNISCQNTAAQPIRFLGKMSSRSADTALRCAD